MKKLLFFILLSLPVNARQIRIAIVDTGMPTFSTNARICPYGEHDFTGAGIIDGNGHGTNIMGIISERLKGIDYCLYILKMYNTGDEDFSFIGYLHAFQFINNLPEGSGVDIINCSFGGTSSDDRERNIIKSLINKNIKFVAAAGNLKMNLDKKCSEYPACYEGVISVGNGNSNADRNSSSNYGNRVRVWRKGNHVCANGICMTGSSQSTAIYSSELAIELYKQSLNVKK